jgi:hypothetical protein
LGERCYNWIKPAPDPSLMQPIHTLDARGHIMLEVIRERFGIAAPEMRMEIEQLHREVIEILASKGVRYSDLRSALVPSADRHEAAFLFDSTKTESGMYGLEVYKQVMPLLDPHATLSVLAGDLLGDDQQLILEILQESIILARGFEFRHASLLYGVYINNLSSAALARLHEQLTAFSAYLGYIPASFASRAKTYLSMCMAHVFLKKGRVAIVGHEDDRSNDENLNITMCPLEDFGYKVISLQGIYQGIFLSYKIERPVHEAFAVDSEMALNAISSEVADLGDFRVLLEEAKHGYLINEKLGKLAKAGLAEADREYIASLIQSKVTASYIYNLAYLAEHNVMKFNLMIEVERVDGYPTRMTVALEYLPASRTLRVITLY